MNTDFKISKRGKYGILVEGLEQDAGYYIDSILSNEGFSWEDSITLNVLFSETSKGERTYVSHDVVEHCTACSDQSIFELKQDGLYRVYHKILPIKSWVDNYIASNEVVIKDFYYYEDDKFYYRTKDTEPVEIGILELPKPVASNTIWASRKQTFITPYLNDCFNQLVKHVLSLLGDSCNNCETNEYKLVSTNRDIVWMFMNVIKYSLELRQLYEAQRYLEKFWKCNTFCSQNKLNGNINSNGCCGS